jgi:23S rRNA (cytosine1962-C5)-methyltransferase
MTAHPLIRLKPKEGRRARAGAPWIFSNEINMDAATKALKPGALVHVQGDDGQNFGTGYFNPKSLIAVRLLDPASNQRIDAAFFAGRLKRALAIREAIYDAPFYRLAHAEGDGLPGVVIDRFGDLCSVQMTTAGMENLTPALLEALDSVIAPTTVILRNDTPSRALEGLENYVRVVKGDVPARVTVIENGVRYFADLSTGQKSGWYYDQRDNHAFMAKLAKDRGVLDAYCYAGGFAIAAGLGGAKEVVGLDSSQTALTLAEDAARENGVKAQFVKADVFEELERLAVRGDKFDIVIADPPPFVKARKDLEAGAKAYRKLARLAASVTAPGGFLFLASCSHNMPADRFALECGIGILRGERRASLIHQSGAGADHPVHPLLPETAYLKALVYALD